jgi:hypothetical protein
VAQLGFNPRATSFEALVAEMVAADIKEHAAAARVADAMAAASAAPVSAVATQCDAAALAAAAVEAPPAEAWGFYAQESASDASTSDEEAPRHACVAARVANVEARMQQLSTADAAC